MTALLFYLLTIALMKKTLMTVAMAFLAASIALPAVSAQERAKAANDEFTGHWFIGIQGGIGQTVGETSFGNLISPAAAFSFGYQFTPVWGLRAGLSGWQAKGAPPRPTSTSSTTSRATWTCSLTCAASRATG